MPLEDEQDRLGSGCGSKLEAAALDRGALACAAQQLGVCDQLIAMSVDYTTERKQFGVPIGSFQAVKHQVADSRSPSSTPAATSTARPTPSPPTTATRSVRRLDGQDQCGRRAALDAAEPRRSRSTVPSATPGSRTSTSGCAAPGPWTSPGAKRPGIASGVWRKRPLRGGTCRRRASDSARLRS